MPALRATMLSPRLMRAFADAHEAVSFVEIGANDGVLFDPLRPYIAERQWHGVLVEPIPHIFERLEGNYRDHPRIKLERAAIADRAGSRPMYFVRDGAEEDGLSPWRDAIASFDREHVIAELGEVTDPEALVESVEVPCMTVEELCAKHELGTPDLILIDAEGADAEIVASIDLERLRPRLLVYEHVNLDDDERGRLEAAARRRRLRAGRRRPRHLGPRRWRPTTRSASAGAASSESSAERVSVPGPDRDRLRRGPRLPASHGDDARLGA